MAVVFSIGLGVLFGWLSLYVFPDVLVKWGWLRIALLFISPVGSGLRLARNGEVASGEKSPSSNRMTHFWIGLCFSIGFVWVRFAFAHRT